MIPKILWQTYEDDYNDLPIYVRETAQTWIDKNPKYEFKYVNAKQREEFILKYFGTEWLKRYSKGVSGSMKADVWKYLVMYQFGGVYTDMDYSCERPISFWCKDNFDMIIGADEMPNEIACHLFASKPNHPALKSILDVVYNNLEEIDFSIELIPYTLTGPTAFTKGIKQYLNIDNELNLLNNVQQINNSDKAIGSKIYCYGNENFNMFTNIAVTDLMGRQNWYDGKYDWVKEGRERYRRLKNDS